MLPTDAAPANIVDRAVPATGMAVDLTPADITDRICGAERTALRATGAVPGGTAVIRRTMAGCRRRRLEAVSLSFIFR